MIPWYYQASLKLLRDLQQIKQAKKIMGLEQVYCLERAELVLEMLMARQSLVRMLQLRPDKLRQLQLLKQLKAV
jgi:hypothetical protein